ncbi:MAG: CpsD/CapB family tyrosine-protein kinase, partial [Gemmatimonadales bacterium]
HRLADRTVKNGLPDGVVADSRWPSVGAEAFRLLYSSLQLGWVTGRRTFLITSVAPQEGKTLIAANLAVTFAREGARVLLIDCDLRRPRLHKMFRVSRAPGLTEMLRKQSAPVEEPVPPEPEEPVIQSYSMTPGMERPGDPSVIPPKRSTPEHGLRISGVTTPGGNVAGANGTWAPPGVGASSLSVRSTSIKGLSLLPCGSLPANPAQALTVSSVRAMLDEMADDFDVIIFDTPPVLVSADAPILAPLVDEVLLVVRAGQTDREATERAYQQLSAAGASVVGAVLNDPAGEVARFRKLYYSYDYPLIPD